MGDSLPSALFRSTLRITGGDGAKKPLADGRYERVGALGKGGMGSVERGLDRFLGREVALKRAHRDDPRLLEVLLREAEVAARLHHPSIVTIHDIADDDKGDPFVVMRLVEGKPLSELVAEAKTFEARLRLLPRVTQAIEAIAFAHRHGVVHRDLKPANIVVGDLGDTVVIDWGLALVDGVDPFAGATVGTDGFMSPEQARGDAVDARTDVYALGVTLFYVLTGMAPDEQPLVAVEPGVPRDLATIVEKARAREAAKRYANAEELAIDLQRFIGGQLVRAHHYGLAARVAKQVRRHPVATIALVAALVVGVTALVGIISAKHAAEAARARAAKRADEILLAEARNVLVADPARAVALLDLREDRHDAWSRAITADAAARGVPHVWHATDSMIVSVQVLANGNVVTFTREHGALVRIDGTVRSLPGSTGRSIALSTGFLVDTGNNIDRFDLDGTKIDYWVAKGDIKFAASGDWFAWCDDEGVHVRALDVKTAWEQAGAAKDIAIDPTGTWLAVARDNGITLLELATGKTRGIASAPNADLAWSASGALFAAMTAGKFFEWKTGEWDAALRERAVGSGWYLGYRGERAIAREITGCIHDLAIDLSYGCDGQITALSTEHGRFAYATPAAVSIYNGASGWILRGVPGTVTRLAVDPTEHYAVASTKEGDIARWDLAASGVTNLDTPVTSFTVLADGTPVVLSQHAITVVEDAPRTIPLPRELPGMRIDAMGVTAVALQDTVTGHVWITRVDTGELVRELEGNPFEILDDDTLVVGDGSRVATLDIATGARKVVHDHPGAPRLIAAGDGMMGAIWDDDHVWWRDAHGNEHTAQAYCHADALALDDTYFEIACGGTLERSRGGRSSKVASVLGEIVGWKGRAHGYVVSTKAHEVYVVDRERRLVATSTIAPAIDEDRCVTADANGAIRVHDLASGASFEIGRVDRVQQLAITDSGDVIAAGAQQLLRWRDPTPKTGAGWPAWRARLTNATLADPAAPIVWR